MPWSQLYNCRSYYKFYFLTFDLAKIFVVTNMKWLFNICAMCFYSTVSQVAARRNSMIFVSNNKSIYEACKCNNWIYT